MYKNLIYLSQPINPFGHISDIDILRAAEARNAALDVTGILLRGPRFFCQALEGTAEQVHHLMDMIRKDPRHSDIREFGAVDVPERRFSGWSMAYAEVGADVHQELERLHTFGHGAAAALDLLVAELEKSHPHLLTMPARKSPRE